MASKSPIKLYTKSGDQGMSGLADGRRLGKDELIYEVLGTIDELNSHIGYAVITAQEPYRQELLQIQDNIMIIGGEIAGSKRVAFEVEQISNMEQRIDYYQKATREDWYTKFLLPGGTEMAGRLDIARSVSRRLERTWIRYITGVEKAPSTVEKPTVSRRAQDDTLDLESVSSVSSKYSKISRYLNRMSDYLFSLRCFVNSQAGYEEKIFKPRYLDTLG